MKYNPQQIEKKWPPFAKALGGKLQYNHHQIEEKWQKRWLDFNLFQAKDFDKRPKFYCLDMFPYPSGSGLHVGHWRGYVLSDTMARFYKMQGKNVLHPMGYDAFGLPAENAAIKKGIHPKKFTYQAIEKFDRQLRQLGAMYDWERRLVTSLPSYYKWTQWLFLQLYKKGLAYRKEAQVNFCPSCQTVLANEQVIDGQCERCETEVSKKVLKQWFFKITDYSQRLLDDLEKIDWPARVKIMQKNWIGRSQGAMIKFKVAGGNEVIEVFTTRPDTLYGATFMVLAPEHPLILKITKASNKARVEKYINETLKKKEWERESGKGEKTGVFLGSYAINPINNQKIPIWCADYILQSYGTGAVMSVPAHDKRDFAFAKKFNLPIKIVISKNKKNIQNIKEAYEGNGIMINSGKYDGLDNEKAGKNIIKDLSDAARPSVNYRLRDWLISRQRYWGAPIPIIYCEKCGEVPIPEKDLPVLLPENIEYKPTGQSPLLNIKEFVNVPCPQCHKMAKRETDTMDTFVCSSWYYLRYTDPKNDKVFADPKKVDYWCPVDLYIGGIEHAILHLLYSRFVAKVLYDLKLISFDEPFKKLFNIGMIYLHGAKMSKSKGNVISPDELITKYGTDSLRGYELFIGPPDQDSEWNPNGITGVFRFLEKLWNIIQGELKRDDRNQYLINLVVKKVTQDLDNFSHNTAIAHLMETLNKLDKPSQKEMEIFIQLCAPFFPHISCEIWQKLGQKDCIFDALWPQYDENVLVLKKITLPVQINGKLKGVVEIDQSQKEDEIVEIAKQNPKISDCISRKKIEKVIYRSGKILNFVIK
jgi:leucyl-tRNA synthetase